jgi:hypothetical protein
MSPKVFLVLLCPALLLAPTALAGSASVADPAGDQTSRMVDRRAPVPVTCQAPATDVVALDASSDGAVVMAGFQAFHSLARASCGGVDVFSERDSASYHLFVQDPAYGIEFIRVLVNGVGGTCTSVQFHDVGATSCVAGGSLERVSMPIEGTVSTSQGVRTFDLEGASVHVTLLTATKGWAAPGFEYVVSDLAATPPFTA